MKNKILYFVIGFVFCLILCYSCSLIRCEVLTHRHYDEFKDAYKQNTMFGDIEFFKVLEYETCGVAKVYYVTKNYSSGSVLTFGYVDGEWKEVSWGGGWSAEGNADEMVYPYIWHFIYFLI